MSSKTGWFMPLAGFLVVVAFGVGVIATAAYNTDKGDASQPVSAAGGQLQEIDVELGELYIKPASLQATAGALRINVHNAGQAEHNFSLGSLGATKMLGAGESATLDIANVDPGRYEFVCEVAGHADGGMKGTLTVTSGSGGAVAKGGSAEGHEGMAGMSAKEMAEHDAAVTAQFPAKTKGVGGTLLEPEIEDDGTKVYELTAAPVKWEVEPGKTKEAWAYNGIVPGPTVKPELGDRVRIVLRNELDEPTTMHFHGMTLPSDMDGVPVVSQEAVLPGDSFSYEFTIRNTGSNMYHSHFNAQKQVPMGLLGAMIVPDPKDPEVDQDLNMILNDGPLGYTLNGKGFPATAPIVAARGETVRIRYMNEGLQIHPMHLHGMPQTVIAVDGHLLKQPYDLDTVLVAPGQRIDVLVKATEPGTWAFHCHVLTHAEGPEGMFGMVTAMLVQ